MAIPERENFRVFSTFRLVTCVTHNIWAQIHLTEKPGSRFHLAGSVITNVKFGGYFRVEHSEFTDYHKIMSQWLLSKSR